MFLLRFPTMFLSVFQQSYAMFLLCFAMLLRCFAMVCYVSAMLAALIFISVSLARPGRCAHLAVYLQDAPDVRHFL